MAEERDPIGNNFINKIVYNLKLIEVVGDHVITIF